MITSRCHVILMSCTNYAWYSKQKNMMETSTFGSVYIAAKAATEMIQDLLYNLYMMGIHIYGSTNMFHDNEAVVGNSTMPESTLKKKLVAVCYCCVQEACALGMIQITKVD